MKTNFSPSDELEAIRAIKSKASFKEFVKASWPILAPATPYKPGYHHEAIIEHLQAIRDGQIKRLTINCPPRFGKSMLVSVLYHPWVWLTTPSANCLCTSFKSELSTDFSLKSQSVVFDPWYEQHYGHIVQFNKNSRRTIESYTNAATGERRAGVYATSTGFGPSGPQSALIVDDPHSSGEVNSDTVRQKELEIFDIALSNRVQHGAAIIIAAQRLHENDLSGYLLDRGGYVHLNLPNEYEEDRKCFTVIGYSDPRTIEGALLWPEVCTAEVTEQHKIGHGSFAYAGQFQQRPTSKKGGLINPEWFKTWTPSTLRENFDETLISCDFSFKGGAKNDYNVFQVWGRSGGNFYLLDQVRRQMDFVDTVRAFQALCSKWPTATTKVVEEAANGAAIISQLKDKISGIIAVKPKDSKEARVSAVSPFIEAGNVFIPETAVWKDAFLHECAVFPKGKHDDSVDAMTQALLRFDRTRRSSTFGFVRHRVV